MAADEQWLSAAYGRDSAALHFTWIADEAAVRPVVGAVEAALDGLDARPHWGKVFSTPPEQLAQLWAHLSDFVEAARAADPTGKFRNAFLDRNLPDRPWSRGPGPDAAATRLRHPISSTSHPVDGVRSGAVGCEVGWAAGGSAAAGATVGRGAVARGGGPEVGALARGVPAGVGVDDVAATSRCRTTSALDSSGEVHVVDAGEDLPHHLQAGADATGAGPPA